MNFFNRYFLMLVSGAVAIGFAPILVRLSDTGPIATAFWRVLLAAPFFFALHAIPENNTSNGELPHKKLAYAWLWIIGLGATFGLLLGLGNAAVCYTSVASAIFLGNCSAIFLPLLLWGFCGQRPSLLFTIGLTAAILGMTFLFNDPPEAAIQTNNEAATQGINQDLLGKIYAVLAAISYTAYILITKKLRNYYSTNAIQKYSCIFSSIVLIPFISYADEQFLPLTIAGWGSVIGLAVISQVLGQGLITSSLRHVPTNLSGLTLLLQPLVAAILSAIVLNESFTLERTFGCLLVLIGVACAKFGDTSISTPLMPKQLNKETV